MIESVLQLLVIASIYAILGVSMNLLLSQVGIFSMAYGGMFGVGAYAAALALLRGLPFSVAALAAVALCAVAGALVSIPALRTSGDYFIAATFALQVIAFDLFTNLVTVTNGPAGLYGVPPPRVLGFAVQSSGRFLALAAALVALALYVAIRIRRSNFGLVLRAISEDEVAPAALGREYPLLQGFDGHRRLGHHRAGGSGLRGLSRLREPDRPSGWTRRCWWPPSSSWAASGTSSGPSGRRWCSGRSPRASGTSTCRPRCRALSTSCSTACCWSASWCCAW